MKIVNATNCIMTFGALNAIEIYVSLNNFVWAQSEL